MQELDCKSHVPFLLSLVGLGNGLELVDLGVPDMDLEDHSKVWMKSQDQEHLLYQLMPEEGDGRIDLDTLDGLVILAGWLGGL